MKKKLGAGLAVCLSAAMCIASLAPAADISGIVAYGEEAESPDDNSGDENSRGGDSEKHGR